MDFLQIALILFILILTVMLTILGLQVFFILNTLKKALTRLDQFIGEVEEVAKEVGQAGQAVGREIDLIRRGKGNTGSIIRRMFKKRQGT